MLGPKPSDAKSVEVVEKYLCEGIWEKYLLNWIKGMEEMLRNHGEGFCDFKTEKTKLKRSAASSTSKTMMNKGIFCEVYRLVIGSMILISVFLFCHHFVNCDINYLVASVCVLFWILVEMIVDFLEQ